MPRPTRRIAIALAAAIASAAPPAASAVPLQPAAGDSPAAAPAPPPAEADRLFPDTPVGRRARAWYEAVRANRPGQIEAMIRAEFDAAFLERVPIEHHVAMHRRLAAAGVALPHSIASQDEHEITYFIRDGGVWGQLRIRVSPDEPHAITDVGVRPSGPPAELAGRPETMEAFATETREFIGALNSNGRFSGEAYIARAGNPAVEVSCIDPPETSHDPHALPHTVPIGELVNAIHATAIAQEVSAGRLWTFHMKSGSREQLEDSINSFPPDDPESSWPHIHALLYRRVGMSSTDAVRTTFEDLSKLATSLLDPEHIRSDILVNLTTGDGPDLDPSPRVTRRQALGFEERIDHLEGHDIRSFSATGGDESTHVLLRCYPATKDVVLIVADNERSLRLIDRRIFNRLPGLDEQTPPDP